MRQSMMIAAFSKDVVCTTYKIYQGVSARDTPHFLLVSALILLQISVLSCLPMKCCDCGP